MCWFACSLASFPLYSSAKTWGWRFYWLLCWLRLWGLRFALAGLRFCLSCIINEHGEAPTIVQDHCLGLRGESLDFAGLFWLDIVFRCCCKRRTIWDGIYPHALDWRTNVCECGGGAGHLDDTQCSRSAVGAAFCACLFLGGTCGCIRLFWGCGILCSSEAECVAVLSRASPRPRQAPREVTTEPSVGTPMQAHIPEWIR